MPEAARPWLAVALALTAIIGFDIMAILVRVLSERGYSAPELSAYRNVLGVIPSLLVMIWMGELSVKGMKWRIERWKLALLRGVIVAVAQLTFYSALGILELATVSALAQTNPLFLVILSVLLFGERVGPWRIAALILGFAGALWVMRPGGDTFTPAALLPVTAAFFYALAIISVRAFDSSVSNALLYLYSSVASAGGAIVLALLSTGFSPIASGFDVLLIVVMSLAGGTAVLFLMLAYRMAPPSLLAPFNYLGILTAFFFGWVFFGEAPIETLFPGVILIVGAGVLLIWREQVRSNG